MRALIVVESVFGNTRKVAAAIAEGLASAGVGAVVEPADRSPSVAGFDLVVVGAPTHLRGLPSARSREQTAARGLGTPPPSGVREWLDETDLTPVPHLAAFDTVVQSRWAGSAAKVIRRKMRRRGRVRTMSFVVQGKPVAIPDGELENARTWGASLPGMY